MIRNSCPIKKCILVISVNQLLHKKLYIQVYQCPKTTNEILRQVIKLLTYLLTYLRIYLPNHLLTYLLIYLLTYLPTYLLT